MVPLTIRLQHFLFYNWLHRLLGRLASGLVCLKLVQMLWHRQGWLDRRFLKRERERRRRVCVLMAGVLYRWTVVVRSQTRLDQCLYHSICTTHAPLLTGTDEKVLIRSVCRCLRLTLWLIKLLRLDFTYLSTLSVLFYRFFSHSLPCYAYTVGVSAY